MDTSKEYIEMCRKSWDDLLNYIKYPDWINQGYCTRHECLLTSDQDGSEQCPIFMDIVYKDELKKYEYHMKLFRAEKCGDEWITLFFQDQLQGMVRNKFLSLNNLIRSFFNWSHCTITYAIGYNSMEQFWLAFVMHEKYQKKWDGEDWVDK